MRCSAQVQRGGYRVDTALGRAGTPNHSAEHRLARRPRHYRLHLRAEEAVMHPLCFRFRNLHPDAPELRENLDWLLRFVAAELEILVHGELIFDEIEFPVLDLALALDTWMVEDMAAGRGLQYEVPGGETGALCLRHGTDGWLVDSVHRAPNAPVPPPVAEEELRAAIRSFLERLERDADRDYEISVRALLERVRSSAAR